MREDALPLELSAEIIDRVAALLGRRPRGLEAIAVAREDGSPMVIRVCSLVDEKPFPTLFWLVDPELCYAIDRAEAAGLIKRLQAVIDDDPDLQAAMRQDNRAHIALREKFMEDEVRQNLEKLGFGNVLGAKGIGGIGDFSRIRCLHTWYAAHLVVPNTVGRLLDAYWAGEARIDGHGSC
jgi:hypothetical protein